MFGSMGKFFRDWRRDTGGNFATLTAISTPPVMVLFAGLITYSNTVTLKTQTQAAVDAAALAASTAFANGTVQTAADAQAIATKVFTGNAPAQAISGQTCLSAVTTPPGPGVGYVTTTMKFCGTAPTIFGKLFGGSNSFTATSTSSAQIVNSQSAAGVYNGWGQSWGDPHMNGANGDDFYYACHVGKWTNAFSDYGVQINGLCDDWYGQAEIFTDVAMILGDHYVYITSGYPGIDKWWQNYFKGTVTIDGVPFTPSASGTYTLLNDTRQTIKVTEYFGAYNQPSTYANYLIITLPEYTISIDYGNWGTLNLQVTAKNAGVCGVPGGVMGQTWGSVANTDHNGYNFEVPGATDPWYRAPQYSATCNNVAKTTVLNHAKITQ